MTFVDDGFRSDFLDCVCIICGVVMQRRADSPTGLRDSCNPFSLPHAIYLSALFNSSQKCTANVMEIENLQEVLLSQRTTKLQVSVEHDQLIAFAVCFEKEIGLL